VDFRIGHRTEIDFDPTVSLPRAKLLAKGVVRMRKKSLEIDFRKEAELQIEAIKSRIGQEVPLSTRYAREPRAILVSVEGDTATIRFPNGAILSNVPIRDRVRHIVLRRANEAAE